MMPSIRPSFSPRASWSTGRWSIVTAMLMERVGNVSVASAIWDDLGETLEKVLFRKVQAQLGKARFRSAAKRWMNQHPDDLDELGDAVD